MLRILTKPALATLLLLALAPACGSDPNVLTGKGFSAGNGTSTTTKQDDSGASGDTCVDAINAYRATVGMKPLARWTEMEACSSSEAESDSSTKQAHGAFGKCTEMAQNECPGWPGPEEKMITRCLKAMWDEGPGGGHYENMKGAKYTKVACGFHTMPNGDVWAVQNFR